MSAPFTLSATELAHLLASREASSAELVRAHLSRIDAVDGRIHAFTEVFREQAMAQAEERDAERQRGAVRGPLHGLPISVKECFDIAGRATTLGLPSWRGRVAEEDAVLVAALRAAGAVVLGRTNLSQTMLFVEARNPLFGETKNPFSEAHTPGGSSGGEAAAIAAGMSPLGVGTDIGGSIRTPCHFSGIAGLKPTLDRLPSRGQRTVLAGQEIVRSTPGPMARKVKDLTLFMHALDARALSAADGRVPPLAWEDPKGIDVQRLRVGVYSDDGVLPASRACARAVERAGEALRARGCKVIPFAPPAVPEAIDDYLAALSSDGAATFLEALDGGAIDPVLKPLVMLARVPGALRRAAGRAAKMANEERMAKMLMAMGEKPVREVWRLTDKIRGYRARLLDAMAEVDLDLLVCPPFATPALPHGMSKNFTLASSYAMLFNLTQLPAGTLPITQVRDDETDRPGVKDSVEKQARDVDARSRGLPVGVQVVGKPWREADVLAAMQAIEEEVAGEAPRTPVMEKR